MPKTQAERVWRAKHLPLDQAVIDAYMHPSPETGVELLTPNSLETLRRLCPVCGERRCHCEDVKEQGK